jgi:hypothetical protein
MIYGGGHRETESELKLGLRGLLNAVIPTKAGMTEAAIYFVFNSS